MTEEPELTAEVALCDRWGRLRPDAIGWSRRPLHHAAPRWAPGRVKRWDYWCIISSEAVIAATYADVDYLGLASVWVLDRRADRAVGAEVLRPGGVGFHLGPRADEGIRSFVTTDFELAFVESAASTRIIVATDRAEEPIEVQLEVARPPGHETMNVVIPWSRRRYQYTSKQVARPTSGQVVVGGRRWELGGVAGPDAWGVLDLGRGVWRYRNRWNWAAAAGTIGTGRVLGLQFGGKWTEGTGFTENALCVDGRLSKLGRELSWDYDWDDPMRPWRLRDPFHGQVDLELRPDHDRWSRTSLGVLSMEVHQCFGTWHGHVVDDDGERHEVDGMDGFAEEARNRW